LIEMYFNLLADIYLSLNFKRMLILKPKRKKILLISLGIIISVVAVTIPLIFLFRYIPINTRELGQINTGGKAIDVDVDGEIAYVIDMMDNNPDGLVIINISDPYNPQNIESFYDGGILMAVDVVESVVFLANQISGLEVIDISNPLSPVKIDSYAGSVYDVQVKGEIAYITDWNNGLIILNVSNPSNITFISQFPISGACIHVDVYKDVAYIIDHHGDFSGLRLINISDPFTPFQIGAYAPSGVDFWNPIIEGDYAYIGNHALDGGGLHILDVSNPSNIHQVGLYYGGGSIFAAFIHNTKIFCANYEIGLEVLDMTNPISLQKIGQYYDGGAAYEVVVIDNLAYVADDNDGLEIIEILNI
jgi:hypothetical protein